MKIDKNTINKIARLSRIKLDDKESEDYIKDLNSILDWVEQLNEVNTENVEPLSNISSSILPKREDVSKNEKILKEDITVKGFNIGTNSGKIAGQSIMHCHIHLIPRREGDVDNPQGGVRSVIPLKQHYTRKK